MTARSVGFVLITLRNSAQIGCLGWAARLLAVVCLIAASSVVLSQVPDAGNVAPAPVAGVPLESGPIAIVPVDTFSTVTGALRVADGKAIIDTNGTVTSGAKTTEVVLPKRGMLRVCASTSVHLATDASVPAGEIPGLMMALDRGAVEASFATGRNSDIVLTPDFRILIGGPGSAEVKVRLGQHGDTCVDNPGADAPYVVVSSVFDGGAYRVKPGQRVMFQHGSLSEVVDQEKEPCGCPAEARPGTNDFPLAQSAGLAPMPKPEPEPAVGQTPEPTVKAPQTLNEPLVYTAPDAGKSLPAAAAEPNAQPASSAPMTTAVAPPPAPKKRPGFFRSLSMFFKKIFGAE